MSETSLTLIREGLAAQLYKIDRPNGPLWHVLREDLRELYRVKADDHLEAQELLEAKGRLEKRP